MAKDKGKAAELDHAELARQLEEFEEKQRQEKIEHQQAILKPVLDQIRIHEEALAGLYKIQEKLTGKGKTEKAATGERQRLSTEEKVSTFGQAVYSQIKNSKGKKFKSSELQHLTGKYSPGHIIDIWNTANPDQKIEMEGTKGSAKYGLA